MARQWTLWWGTGGGEIPEEKPRTEASNTGGHRKVGHGQPLKLIWANMPLCGPLRHGEAEAARGFSVPSLSRLKASRPVG